MWDGLCLLHGLPETMWEPSGIGGMKSFYFHLLGS